MRRRVVAISVLLVALASLVFAGSTGLPSFSMSQSQPQQYDERPSISGNAPKRDYVDMKSDEGWQMEYNGQKIMVVVGNFAAHHNGTVITADSAVRYNERHIECFGNVLINRGSTYIYGDRADYNGDTNEANVYSKIVKVVDGNATLFTYNFSFNTKTNIGHYTGGGVLISGDNMLESDRGYLYSDNNEIICVDRVQMRNNEYDLMGDSVVYNTETDFAQFFTRTNIWNKSQDGNSANDDYLYADRGTFDKRKQLYTLTLNGYILTKEQELLCDTLDYYRDSNYVRLKRNVQIDDSEQKMLLFGDWGEYWKEPGNIFVTKDPSIISYDTSQGDSLFMRSDSIFVNTRYPIREKIEQALKDSLAQAAKSLDSLGATGKKSVVNDSLVNARKSAMEKMAAQSRSKSKHAATEHAKRGDDDMDRRRGRERRRNEGSLAEGRASAATSSSAETSSSISSASNPSTPPSALSSQKTSKHSSVDTAKVAVDTTKVAVDTTKVVVAKTRSELRREMIDSLINDTINPRSPLLAKLLKEEAAELNRVVKGIIKEEQLKRKAERAAVLAERNTLYKRLLGEAKVRDAERRRIEREIEKRVSDSLKRVNDSLKRLAKIKPDSTQLDSLKRDSLKLDTIKVDSIRVDSTKVDSAKIVTTKVDSVKVDTTKVDSIKIDTTKVDSLAKFDTMTVKQVKAYFKAIYDKEKAEEERVKQDSLNAKLDRIGLARQAKRVEQYRKWAIRDSIFNAKAQERADEQLRRKLARQEKRGIFIKMADSSELRIVDSILLAEFGPLDSIVGRRLDSLIEILYPKAIPSPTEIAKEVAENIDSLYRVIRAYSHVKMYRSDFQSICDSLTMTTVDSIIHLYKLPVMWNGNSQITSEIMHITTRNSQLAQADFEGKPLTVSQIDTAHYNQVTGKEMTALFRDNQMYRNDVKGNVQTIYYMQEDNSPEISLMAYIEAGDMTSYIENQQVVAITYRGNPVYTFYPMDKIPETQPKKLPNFVWEASRRPAQDSVFTRTIVPSQRVEKRALRKPLFPINALLQQRKADYIRRHEWQDRTDTLTYETIEWLESLKSF
uniref:OstA-like protein n=1 Tax=Alistipes sp. TaxID=1872444 RepID=UPI0040577D99